MTKPAGQEGNKPSLQPDRTSGDDPFGLAPWLKEVQVFPLHPLMAHPVAAMAATTAIGFGIASQMAGLMLGAMQGAAARTWTPPDEGAEGAQAPETVKTVVPKGTEPVARAKSRVAGQKAKAARVSATPKAEAGPKRKAPAGKTAMADDLKAISGIGPKLEQVLNGKGFRQYADLAAMTAAKAAEIDAELGLDGRIARDGWVEQARTLAKARG